LHLWSQVVGKVRLACSPPQNHYWHIALYLTSRGLTTSPMPYGAETFEIELDFIDQQVRVVTSWGMTRTLPLHSKSVATFYAELMAMLRELGIEVRVWTRPVEIPDPVPFEDDRVERAYDPAAAHTFWRTLLQVDRVFKEFRAEFLGKSSPVHFFWGSFDLAVTRFSGRLAPPFTGPVVNVHPHVMHESYSHEVSSAGFWPGDDAAGPIFYSYAVPAPAGFSSAAVLPTGAEFRSDMGEFVLPYDVVRTSATPDLALRSFLDTTYAAAADLGSWDRAALEHRPVCPCD
jgi:hypothetical protein